MKCGRFTTQKLELGCDVAIDQQFRFALGTIETLERCLPA
jgi:hypothetical protein